MSARRRWAFALSRSQAEAGGARRAGTSRSDRRHLSEREESGIAFLDGGADARDHFMRSPAGVECGGGLIARFLPLRWWRCCSEKPGAQNGPYEMRGTASRLSGLKAGGPPGNRGIWAVIPAYNEDEVLRTTVAEVAGAGYSVVVVDDGSAHRAEESLRGLELAVVRHPVNLGQGASLQTGSDYALAQGASFIVHFDADGQHPVAGIRELVAPVARGECDIAIGSRFLRASDAAQVPPGKKVLLKAGLIVNGLLTGVWMSDAHNGLRVLSREAASRIRIRENGYAHATEILELARRERLRVLEVPCTIAYTDYSRAKGQSILNSFNILIDLLLRRALQ